MKLTINKIQKIKLMNEVDVLSDIHRSQLELSCRN